MNDYLNGDIFGNLKTVDLLAATLLDSTSKLIALCVELCSKK